MAYAVELSARAVRDLNDLLSYLERADSATAFVWFERLERAITGLEKFPRRCPLAPEARVLRRPIRQLLYGKAPHVQRILFEIRERRKTVTVLTVRHGARDEWRARKSKPKA